MDGQILEVNDFYRDLEIAEQSHLAPVDTVKVENGPPSLPSNIGAEFADLSDLSATDHGKLTRTGKGGWCVRRQSLLEGTDDVAPSQITVAFDVTAMCNIQAELHRKVAYYRNSVELAPQINWVAGADGSLQEVSPRWTEVTGIPTLEALGQGWIAALREEDVEPTLASWQAALESKRPVDVEYRLRVTDGSKRWFRSRAVPRIGPTGHVLHWYGSLEDIDDRKRTEQSLRESEERFRLAAHAAGLGVWDFDAVNNRREWSDDFKGMLGLPRHAEPLIENALRLVVPGDRHLLLGLLEAVRAGNSEHRFETTLRIKRADTGAERWMQTSGWRIEAPNGHLERVLVTIRDVTDQRQADVQLRWTANHDGLTQLPNRGFFNEQLDQAIANARERGTKLALVIFDIDNLKEINDTIGHDAGDILLRRFADCLKSFLGEDAFLARLGGDEFAAFMPVGDHSEMASVINASLKEVSREFDCDGMALMCQATAGAAKFPRDGVTAEELLKTADIALYAGKATRRGMLSVFKPEMRADVQRRASMLTVARSVVNDDRVVPFYQPKVMLANGGVVGFEALLRWQHPSLGVQGPGLLSAAFDDLSLATALGERMLDRVCQDISSWRDSGLSFGRVAINLSPAEFRRDDLFDRVMERLHRNDISSALLEIEITETVFLGSGAHHVADVLQDFHRAGFTLALDDFGTGFASLTHLQTFPVDVIKIDRSFVRDVAAGSANAAIVEAVIGLAGRLGMEVIAEGIETRDEATYLSERGCLYGQGFLYSKAVDSETVQLMLSRKQQDSD